MRVFKRQLKPGDEVEATLTHGAAFRRHPHTIRGVMQTPATLVFVSMVTGEVTELDVGTLEDAGYKVRVKHAAALHAGNRR